MAAYDQLFGPTASAVAAHLAKSLKSKELVPDDIFQAYTELFPEFHQAGGDLPDYFAGVIKELSTREVPAAVGKAVISAVRYFRSREEVRGT